MYAAIHTVVKSMSWCHAARTCFIPAVVFAEHWCRLKQLACTVVSTSALCTSLLVLYALLSGLMSWHLSLGVCVRVCLPICVSACVAVCLHCGPFVCAMRSCVCAVHDFASHGMSFTWYVLGKIIRPVVSACLPACLCICYHGCLQCWGAARHPI
jgi:hypothetical protein